MRYTRHLSSHAFDSAMRSTAFAELKRTAAMGFGSVCLLENDEVQLNYGTTRLARLKFAPGSETIEVFPGGRLVPPGSLPVELPNCVRATAQRYLCEGRWQDQLCRIGAAGIEFDGKRWFVVDREAVIGFTGRAAKEDFWSRVYAAIEPSVRTHAQSHPRWCRYKRTGDECDVLAISEEGELGCWEVKDGSNGALEWAPFQAAMYREAFRIAAPAISTGIVQMVRQKVALGLLAPAVLSYLPREVFSNVSAAVLVGEFSASPVKSQRLLLTAASVNPTIPVAEVRLDASSLVSFTSRNSCS